MVITDNKTNIIFVGSFERTFFFPIQLCVITMLTNKKYFLKSRLIVDSFILIFDHGCLPPALSA